MHKQSKNWSGVQYPLKVGVNPEILKTVKVYLFEIEIHFWYQIFIKNFDLFDTSCHFLSKSNFLSLFGKIFKNKALIQKKKKKKRNK